MEGTVITKNQHKLIFNLGKVLWKFCGIKRTLETLRICLRKNIFLLLPDQKLLSMLGIVHSQWGGLYFLSWITKNGICCLQTKLQCFDSLSQELDFSCLACVLPCLMSFLPQNDQDLLHQKQRRLEILYVQASMNFWKISALRNQEIGFSELHLQLVLLLRVSGQPANFLSSHKDTDWTKEAT